MMSAKRTIDTTNNEAGTVFIGVRLSAKQTTELDNLAKLCNQSRSGLLRDLIRKAHENVTW
jgi:metal-responsive CopG/Arc/MetJ family transcriptional regulator